MFFPGDPDFTWENYSSLPYSYVVAAYTQGSNLYRERLHDAERPTALNSSLLANRDRDPKKTKAYKWSDFAFYKPAVGGGVASFVYGTAMLSLIKARRLPSWALFCFKEVSAQSISNQHLSLLKKELENFQASKTDFIQV